MDTNPPTITNTTPRHELLEATLARLLTACTSGREAHDRLRQLAHQGHDRQVEIDVAAPEIGEQLAALEALVSDVRATLATVHGNVATAEDSP